MNGLADSSRRLRRTWCSRLAVTLLIAWVALPAIGCASRPTAEEETDSAREAFREQRRKSVSDISPAFIAELDSLIGTYRELSNEPAELSKAHAARRRVVAYVKPYLDAMLVVLEEGGSDERKLASSIALGFVDSQAYADEAVRLLCTRVLDPDRNEKPHTIYGALLAMAELGRLEFTSAYRGRERPEDVPEKEWRPYPTRDQMIYLVAARLSDEYPDIRAVAAESVGRAWRQGDPEEVLEELMHRLAKEPEADIRLLVIEGLARTGDHRALGQIEAQGLVDPDPWVREDSVIALASVGGPQYVDPIMAMLEDPNPGVRAQTIEMLRESFRNLQDPRFNDNKAEIVESISDCLRDRDAEVRERACLALGHIGNEDVVMDLIAKLGDVRHDVRKAAIFALGTLQTKADRAVLPLIKMLSNREADIRDTTRLSLVGITGEDLGDDPNKWQDWFEAGRPGSGRNRGTRDNSINDQPDTPETPESPEPESGRPNDPGSEPGPDTVADDGNGDGNGGADESSEPGTDGGTDGDSDGSGGTRRDAEQ